jgi:release factor glutamine methyltransferase
MQELIKRAAGKVLIPFTKWYLRKQRSFNYLGVRIVVSPGVFHPGLFSSTLFILHFLEKQNLNNLSLLELGCGSGLISVRCAQKGATVTASDISVAALRNADLNAVSNDVVITTVHSDLFERIALQRFDWIIINPPYYAKDAANETEFAWNCGKDFEYFRNLFRELPSYINDSTFILMVLTKGCDLATIFSIGASHGFVFNVIEEKSVPFDQKDFLYRISFSSSE